MDNDGIPSADWKPIEKGRNVRLVVPHYISGERDVKLYLRVQKPERDVYIRIPEINKRTFHPKVMPSEMVTMELSKEELRDIGEKITIEVIRRGEL